MGNIDTNKDYKKLIGDVYVDKTKDGHIPGDHNSYDYRLHKKSSNDISWLIVECRQVSNAKTRLEPISIDNKGIDNHWLQIKHKHMHHWFKINILYSRHNDYRYKNLSKVDLEMIGPANLTTGPEYVYRSSIIDRRHKEKFHIKMINSEYNHHLHNTQIYFNKKQASEAIVGNTLNQTRKHFLKKHKRIDHFFDARKARVGMMRYINLLKLMNGVSGLTHVADIVYNSDNCSFYFRDF